MLTQELISVTYTGVVLNKDSRNSAYTGFDFSLKSGFMKILLTPVFSLSKKKPRRFILIDGIFIKYIFFCSV